VAASEKGRDYHERHLQKDQGEARGRAGGDSLRPSVKKRLEKKIFSVEKRLSLTSAVRTENPARTFFTRTVIPGT